MCLFFANKNKKIWIGFLIAAELDHALSSMVGRLGVEEVGLMVGVVIGVAVL